MSEIIFRHYELGIHKWWNNFCQNNYFTNYKDCNEYLSQFNAKWDDNAAGHYLMFSDEAGYSMFVLRWS